MQNRTIKGFVKELNLNKKIWLLKCKISDIWTTEIHASFKEAEEQTTHYPELHGELYIEAANHSWVDDKTRGKDYYDLREGYQDEF